MDHGYFGIRLESIGGLGANVCGKLLGELAVNYLNMNASSFSSYGSEKTGSPVSAYIRWCPADTEIMAVTPVTKPDIIGIFHEAMIGGRNVFSGADGNTRIIINSQDTPDDIRKRLKMEFGDIYAVNCQCIANECHSRVNMVMLGAIIKAIETVDTDCVKKLICAKFDKYGKNVVDNNIAAFQRGYESTKVSRGSKDAKQSISEELTVKSRYGYDNAPAGGINTVMGSTISNDLSASRAGFVPLYIPEKCIHCGLCDTTCPDMVFRFEPGEYNKRHQMVNCGLDYHHCKGCLRCVAVCPTHALVKGEERTSELKFFVRNKDLIADEIEYESKGANSWVTGEAPVNDGGLRGGAYEM